MSGGLLARLLGRGGGHGSSAGTVWWRREVAEGVEIVRGEIAAPTDRAAAVLRAVAGGVARAGLARGATVGSVGVVSGEEPVLLAFSGSLAAIAERVHATLRQGPGRQRWTLWLSLAEGVFLAQAVDPYAPFAGTDADRSRLVGDGLAVQIVATRVTWTRAAAVVELSLTSSPGGGRQALAHLRRALASLGPWRRTSSRTDAVPSATLNTSPQR